MPKPPDPTRVVLMHPSHPGNVGAVARAIKVMGFSDLVLIAPRLPDVLCRDEAVAFASGATCWRERAWSRRCGKRSKASASPARRR
jgi:tRNA C32,U32 (ribose-2'-O)-methylase TrmJ